jgi:hypothetical protein
MGTREQIAIPIEVGSRLHPGPELEEEDGVS